MTENKHTISKSDVREFCDIINSESIHFAVMKDKNSFYDAREFGFQSREESCKFETAGRKHIFCLPISDGSVTDDTEDEDEEFLEGGTYLPLFSSAEDAVRFHTARFGKPPFKVVALMTDF